MSIRMPLTMAITMPITTALDPSELSSPSQRWCPPPGDDAAQRQVWMDARGFLIPPWTGTMQSGLGCPTTSKMTAFSLSALGLPPFSGFFAKFYVFKAAIGAHLEWAAIAALVGSVVAMAVLTQRVFQPFAAIARCTLPGSCSNSNSGAWMPTIVSPAAA